MDVESDEEDGESKKDEAAPQKTKEAMPPPLPPLPPSLDNILIRKDYNPRTKSQQPPSKAAEAWVVSPITGEKIPAEKLQEHMRYGLLDPRWVEARDRQIQEKVQQEEVYAAGSAIESSLKQLAERRTDIFGSGDEETAIGKKIGEEDRKKPEKITWDGYTASMEAATRAARANITIEEQIQQIHKMKGLLPDGEKEKIGPSLPSTSGVHNMSSQSFSSMQNMARSNQQNNPVVSMMNTSMNPLHRMTQSLQSMSSHMPPPSGAPLMMAPPHQPGPYMVSPSPVMMPMGMYHMGPPPDMHGNPPGMQHPMANLSMVSSGLNLEEEPSMKKLRTEDNLIAEDEFLKRNPGPIAFKVQTPNVPDKPEWGLNGQMITLTLPATDMISVIKAKIHEVVGMPPGKQKLQYEGMFIKDSNTLAFYNVTNGGIVVLGLKERGGRKK